MRLVPPLNTEKTNAIVEAAIEHAEQSVSGISATYKITGDRPPIEQNPTSPLLENLKLSCQEVTGEVPQVSCFTVTLILLSLPDNSTTVTVCPMVRVVSKQLTNRMNGLSLMMVLRCEQVYQQLVKSTI